jgi:hypothetical protein
MSEKSAEAQYNALRAAGFTLPNHPGRARMAAKNATDLLSGSMSEDIRAATGSRRNLSSYNKFGSSDSDEQKALRGMQRTGTTGGGSDARMAWPKQRDPFSWWKERLNWFEMSSEDESGLQRVRDWARLLYITHHLVPSLIDIYTRFPLLDIEFKHKDSKLSDFYNELFFDHLNYEEFLFDMGREHWTVGEAFALGSWNETIGAWEADELLNPMDVKVTRNRSLRSHEFYISVPNEIKRLIEEREPYEEYMALVQMYPDLVTYARMDADIPVSDTLMSHVKFKTDPWNPRGTPILMRAFRTLMLEESLASTQDSIADRLYSPLIMATLGLDNIDDQGPWVPTPEELQSMRDDLQLALNSDFRLMVYHHGLDIKTVFGRESMPKLDSDFERVDKRVMQVFGIGREMLEGGKSGVAYASGALNRELITQMLQTYQGYITKHIQDRMRVVAERQGHYEYEKRGDMRIPIMEDVLVVDEETGEERIEKMPKLAIPEVSFKAMNLRDEKTERDFLFALRDKGFPISDQTLAVNIPIEFDEESERVKEEKIRKVILEAQFKKELFERLVKQDLPIPVEYKQDYDAWKQDQEGAEGEGQEAAGAASSAMKDITAPPPTPNLGPDSGDGQTGTESAGEDDQAVQEPEGVPQRPAESDGQRANAPKASSIVEEPFKADLHLSRFGAKKMGAKAGSGGTTNLRVLMKVPKYATIRDPQDEPQFEDTNADLQDEETDNDD